MSQLRGGLGYRLCDSLHCMRIMSLVLCASHKEVIMMGLENTITEQDLDASSRQFVQGFRQDKKELEPDLAVDGLAESVISKFIGLISFRRS